MKYYIDIDKKTAGPFTFHQVKNLVESGKVDESSLYTTPESTDWLPLSLLLAAESDREHDLPTFSSIPPIVINNQSNNQGYYPSGPIRYKSRNTYQLLAFFLGGLGIHNFYAERFAIGIIQLLLTILSCGMLAPLVWIWGVIEIFVVKTDGNNIPMRL